MVARNIQGWTIRLHLVAAGLVAVAPSSARPDTGDADPAELQRVIAVQDAVIADLTGRVEALEEEALVADLRRRADALGHAIAATVAPRPPTRGDAPGPVAGPPPALLAALATPDDGARLSGRAAAPRAGSGDEPAPSSPVVASDAVLAATVGGAGAGPGSPGAIPVSTDGDPAPPIPVAGVAGAGRQNVTSPERPTVVAWTAEPAPDPRDGTPPPGRNGAEPSEDIDDALSALEQMLLEQGGLLLPAWEFEVSAATSYTYDSSGGLQLANGVGIVDRDVRRDVLENSVTVRLGLPWETQAEVHIPYIAGRERISTTGLAERESDGSGLGDVALGLTAQLLRESDITPDLLGSVRWKSNTGESSFDVGADGLAVGSGFHAVSGQLTAVKSIEPLVFFGSASHTVNLPDSKAGADIDPGDTTGFSLGAILAAGPGTSLRFGYEQSFSRNTEVNGRAIPGSDGVAAMLELGASAVLPFPGFRSPLNVTAGIGVTEDAPDLRLEVSLPYRF